MPSQVRFANLANMTNSGHLGRKQNPAYRPARPFPSPLTSGKGKAGSARAADYGFANEPAQIPKVSAWPLARVRPMARALSPPMITLSTQAISP